MEDVDPLRYRLKTRRSHFLLLLATGFGLANAFPAIGASYIVNTIGDVSEANPCAGAPGDCSLRDAITLANRHGHEDNGITFDPTVFAAPRAIVLRRFLRATGRLTITGPEAPTTISGNHRQQVLYVEPGATVQLMPLIIADGFESNIDAGGIHNMGILTVTNCTFSSNSATVGGGGGGIYNLGTLNVNTSSL